MKKLTTKIMDDGDEKEISVFLDDETAKVLEECGDEELRLWQYWNGNKILFAAGAEDLRPPIFCVRYFNLFLQSIRFAYSGNQNCLYKNTCENYECYKNFD